jgi:hypothetical protein
MRQALAYSLAAFLMASPAMAQVVIGGNNDSARHEQNAQQDRTDARQDHADAQRDAAMGNYGDAAHAQREAHNEWRNAHRQQSDTNQDGNGGVKVQIGH